MSNPSPVSKILTASNLPHREFVHPGLIHTIEQAAAERNQSIHQVVRSILFRLAEKKYAMVLIAGPSQVDWKTLRHHFNQSRLTMASPEEVIQVTGYEIGAVAPFGIPEDLPILVDQTVLAQPSVSLGSGRRGTAIMITTEELMRALGKVEIGNFTKIRS